MVRPVYAPPPWRKILARNPVHGVDITNGMKVAADSANPA